MKKYSILLFCIILLCGCSDYSVESSNSSAQSNNSVQFNNPMQSTISEHTDISMRSDISTGSTVPVESTVTVESDVSLFTDDLSEVSNQTDDFSSSNNLSQEELDYIHSITRAEAAKPYENLILPEFEDDYSKNNHVIGHIRLDGTDIDCPVLQKLEDYEYYLTHDIDDNDSKQGCIILDPDSEIGIGTKDAGYLEGYAPSTNQLVHGHNMRAGTMFGTLSNYASEEYALEHKYIYFDSLYEHRVYELVTAFYSQIYPPDSAEFKYYFFNEAKTEVEFNDWYDNIMALSLYRTNIPVKYGDEMITLSTCSNHTDEGRFAVIGKRIK